MSKLFSYYCECYGFYTYLFIGSKEDMLNELYKKPVFMNKESLTNLVNGIRSSDAGFTVDLIPENGVKRYLVCMESFDWIVNDIVTVGHEALHVAQLALLERGISDFANDSCFHCMIYLRDSIERTFLNKLRKWKEEEEKENHEKENQNMDENIESIVNPEEESTADYEMKKEIEKESKNSKKKKKK